MEPMQKLHDACNAVREYKGSDAYRHVDDMLSALIATYQAELEHVAEDQLRPLQAKLRQAAAIRRIILGEQGVPRI